jgi:hypothetical protein
MTPLICKGADGIDRIFYLEAEEDHVDSMLALYVRIHRNNPPTPNADDWVDLTLQERPERDLRVTMMRHGSKPWYARMGILDAAIPAAAALTGRKVVSSSNTHRKDEAEYRTDAAEKVWKRLEGAGLARYDQQEDRYHLL